MLVTVGLDNVPIILDQGQVVSDNEYDVDGAAYSETGLEGVLIADVETLTSTQVQQGVERHN